MFILKKYCSMNKTCATIAVVRLHWLNVLQILSYCFEILFLHFLNILWSPKIWVMNHKKRVDHWHFQTLGELCFSAVRSYKNFLVPYFYPQNGLCFISIVCCTIFSRDAKLNFNRTSSIHFNAYLCMHSALCSTSNFQTK